MSIENELSKLTDAVLKLAGAIAAQEAPQPAAETKPKASKPKAEKAPEPEPPAAAPDDEPAATVEDVREATKQLAALNRDAAVAVLKQFGASKVPEVKEADYGAFVAAAQAKAKELS